MLLVAGVLSDNAIKNHRAEKRQDNSFLFFGGWRPVRPGNPYYHGSATGKFHDLISALPDSLDTSSSYYTHSLPRNYQKDIYSYYPRPAIRSTPKKNTPVYMESYKPQRQTQNSGGRGNNGPQFVDIQKIDLKQLQGLQDIILQAKQLPLTQLNLPVHGNKKYEIIEISLQGLQQNGHNTGSRNNIRYNRNSNWPRSSKSGYARFPQPRGPVQHPIKYEYIAVPKAKSSIPQIAPKEIAVAPLSLPHPVPSVDEVIGIKNIQIVEVPVPVPGSISYEAPKRKGSRGSQYGKRGNRVSQPQYRASVEKSQPKLTFPSSSYFSQAEQPRQHYSAPQQGKPKYNKAQQPEIEAELIKLSEEEVEHLLKNLELVGKNSEHILKQLPLAGGEKPKGEDLHLIVALPDVQHDQTSGGGYEVEEYKSSKQTGGYGSSKQYVTGSHLSYPSKGSSGISHNSGGYEGENQKNDQRLEHNTAGYQIEDQGGNSNKYDHSSYQNLDGRDTYSQQVDYQVGNQKSGYQTAGQQAGYSQSGYAVVGNQQGNRNEEEQPYIQVIAPQVDENGYKREPVLALEIKQGQSIEDAIKSLDPETLQKLGAHGKDGLEIEVVEVPVDEYSAESKKTETFVSSKNGTVVAKATITEKKS